MCISVDKHWLKRAVTNTAYVLYQLDLHYMYYITLFYLVLYMNNYDSSALV